MFYKILLSLFLGGVSPVLAAQNPLVTPPPLAWAMSIEVCKLFPPDIESAIKRGIVRLPRDCRWFVMGGQSLSVPSSPAVWSTKELCEKASVPITELFFERKRNCQILPE
jgi:hypothetical protein